MTTAPRTVRTRQPHVRSAAWLNHIGTALGTLRITQDGVESVYSLSPIPSAFGTAVRFEKLGDASENYETLDDGPSSSCTCKGHTYGGYCRHTDSLRALINAGKL